MESIGGWLATGIIAVLVAYYTIKGLYNQFSKIKEGHCACSGSCSCQDCPESGKPAWGDSELTTLICPRDNTNN